MHSHQRMTQYIRKTNINDMQGGRDADQKITQEQAEQAGLINFLRGGKTYGGETIINRIRMFTYRIGLGGGIGIFFAIFILLVFLFIGYKYSQEGNLDFIKGPLGLTVKPTHKFEFF
jgi:hypothetical protein